MTQQFKEDYQWLAWLEYFYVEADFGPADSDVRDMMYESFKQETGHVIDEMEDDS